LLRQPNEKGICYASSFARAAPHRHWDALWSSGAFAADTLTLCINPGGNVTSAATCKTNETSFKAVSDTALAALQAQVTALAARVTALETQNTAQQTAINNLNTLLAGVTRTDNPTWYNARAGGDAERDMKRALHHGGFETLNVYSNLAGGYLGYAYLPGLPDSKLYMDGIVLNWESVPGASTTFAGRYDLGLTLVHEAGHWVNLEHTFFGGCNAKGDFVDDTPAMLVPTNGCPVGKDTCPEPGLDPIHNYMDYSYDSCYTEFTPGQVARAQDSWVYFRAP